MVVDRSNNPADKVVDYGYQYYDANGKNNNRIRQITDNIDTAYTTSYLYDDYNRLTSATANAFSRSYQYDEWVNIKNFAGLTLNYQVNASGAPTTNRINTDSQSYSYSYDAAGNQTVGAGQTYSYDGANRLKTASGGTSSYGYDGDGKRVKKTENGATTYYVYSSKLGQSVMEVTANSIQRAYVYSGSKLVAMQATDGQFYWLHTNHLGNSRAMTDASGNLTYKGQFDPYGAALTEWANSGNTNLNSKKFTGYERDSATGLDYAQARMYNSSRGRFMTPDPIGFKAANPKMPQSLNRYSYVENDPVNFIDSSGTLKNSATCMMLRTWTDHDDGTRTFDYAWYCTVNPETDIYDGGGQQLDNPVQNANNLIDDAINLAERLLRNKGCRTAIENAAYAAFVAATGATPSEEEAKFIRENITAASVVIDKLRGATRNVQETNYHEKFNATANFGTNTITFYRNFFQQRTRNTIRNNNDPEYTYTNRSNREMAQTAIHEGLHLLFAGASDERLGVAFSGRPITGNEGQRSDEGSRRISAAIQQHCQNEGQ